VKTATRSNILDFIKKNEPVRPDTLRKKLGLSPQAIHRQLRNLIDAGLIERRGRAPYTRYVMAGIPDFSAAFDWLSAARLEESPDPVCTTRDVLTARLPRLKQVAGISEGELALLIATVGEIGNNSFDHNLGLWRDVPGCWLEEQTSGGKLWLCVADRGQGILRSLARVLPELADDQAALEVAFNEQSSGRAPEPRGNGLKFVKETVTSAPGRGLACCSGSGILSFGALGDDAEALLRKKVGKVGGTVTLLLWELT
jgi:hypothetical protein